jgi:oxygen-dependent protoporphyrinogen oxidase
MKLVELGANVTVFEQHQTLGGRARSDVIDGSVVDTGAQLFGSAFDALFDFAARVGGADLLVRSPGRDAMWRGGRIHPITYGNVASMVTSTALPTSLKLKLATRYLPFLLRHGDALDASDPLARGGDALEGESVAAWGTRELGHDFVELLAYPLLGAYYGGAPEVTSVVLYHALARAGLDVTVHAVRGGTGALFEKASETLRSRGATIRLNSAVSRVAAKQHAVSIDNEEFDGAVLALPPRAAQSVFDVDDVMRVWLEGVRFVPSAVLALVLNQRIRASYFGVSIPRGEPGSDLVAVCVQHQKTEDLVPANQSLLICLGAPGVNEELISAPEAAVTRMIDAVEQILPGTGSTITRAKLYRHVDGYPLFYPGYLKHLRAFPLTAQTKRVMLAGDYLIAPTVEGAIRSGARSAQQLYDQLGATF